MKSIIKGLLILVAVLFLLVNPVISMILFIIVLLI